MEAQCDWEKLTQRIERLMRLKSFPVAFKMLREKSDLDAVPFLRRPDHKVTLCQLINLVRNFDWTVGAAADDFLFPSCPSVIGLADVPDSHKDGTFRSIVWVATKEDGRKFEASIPRLPLGEYQAVALAPLVYNPFEPDMVLIYANPAQMMLLINSLQFSQYEVMQFFCVGESSCSDAIARCFNTGKPSLSIPCYGERRYGHTQDEDLVMAVPAGLMEKALQGMEALYRRGVRYPISYAGAEADITPQFPVTYKGLEAMMEKVKGRGHPLLVGLTGGIASGKTTVSKMLMELGAPLIDFDVIAREVVEPGTPALEKIVDYFGRQVLQPDGRLDRKKLSQIVFRDFEKRKKLESFTHPPIYEEFFNQVNAITAENPNAIIQVAVPLLIELNLQYLFDTIVLVYISPAEQIRRLAERDGITTEEAANILKAQLPIAEKKAFASFVVNNEQDLDNTSKQVRAVWQKLNELQQSRLSG
ncbi:dephospho-CoA kinase [Desulfoferrobacter suflitae]|uniref:dephospho-CoA kinase n=1 Tax=Desulfoferrobacter suflitae TaxID=2865782 RepID=UPI00216421DE|nr:dephospho-CoA kinase [Desulfoferrobacter suflitae]MCK8602739.1 dephospho-CoA kinase [Desulfoferrobacter suflitae]